MLNGSRQGARNAFDVAMSYADYPVVWPKPWPRMALAGLYESVR